MQLDFYQQLPKIVLFLNWHEIRNFTAIFMEVYERVLFWSCTNESIRLKKSTMWKDFSRENGLSKSLSLIIGSVIVASDYLTLSIR